VVAGKSLKDIICRRKWNSKQCGAQYGDISYYYNNTIKYKALYIMIIQYGPFLYWEYKGGKSHIANIGMLDRGQFA
jgi:hypothetical protein